MSADTPLTVRATRRTITIDDIVAANGTRVPSEADARKRFTLGIVLVVASDTTDARIVELANVLLPVANDLAPAFHDATRERGQMDVITRTALPILAPDAGTIDDAGVADAGIADAGVPPVMREGCSCRAARTQHTPIALLILLLVIALRRRA
jgi:MYXO-CTERM domain-containing protein